jgi:hypothetical protein
MNHAFFTCPNIVRVWFGSCLSIRIPENHNLNFSDWLFEMILHNNEDVLIQLTAIINQIWFARNLSIFEDKYIPEEEIIHRAETNIQEYRQAHLPAATNTNHIGVSASTRQSSFRSQVNRRSNVSSHWCRPATGIFKANSDANLSVHGRWGIGAIIRNEEGLVMLAATCNVAGNQDPLTAEAYSLLSAMQISVEGGFRNMQFESDSESLIRKVKEDNKIDRSYLGLILQEIRMLQSSFDMCLFSFAHRASNTVAHSLAHLAHSVPNLVWVEEVPEAIHNVYFSDLIH